MGWAAVLGCWPAFGRAQFGATAEVEAPLASEGVEGAPTAAATSLRRDESPRAAETLADRLAEAPGAGVRRYGASGAFAGVSLRGADLDQVELLVEDVPVGPLDGGAGDLSLWPLDAFEAVEVFRGPVPLRLGAGGIGGALRLRLAPDPSERAAWLEARGALGSFGTAGGSVRSVLRPGRWRLLLGAGGRHSEGDYPYLDDGGTRFDASDDVERRRRGGRLSRGWALAAVRGRGAGARWSTFVLAVERAGGLQGAPVEEPVFVRRAQRLLLWGGAARWGGEGDAAPGYRVSVAGLLARRDVADLLGEMFPGGSVRRDASRRLQGRFDATVPLGGGLRLEALGSVLYEGFEPTERLRPVVLPGSHRWRFPLGAELRWRGRPAGRRLLVTLQGRLEPWTASLGAVRPERLGATGGGTGLAPTARLGVAWAPARGVALLASAGRAVRLPSLFELFGDGAWVLGDASLRPETAWSGEVAAVLAGRRGPLRGRAEVRAFARRSRDLIRYVRNSRFQVVPRNVDRASTLGVEAGARGRLGVLRSTVTATWLRAVDEGLGRALPLRPALRLFGRLGVSLPVSGGLLAQPYVDAEYVSSSYADPANTVRIDGRTVLGAGVQLTEPGERPRWRLRLSVRDLLDERPLDVVGFPLPGRRWAAQLVVSEPVR